MSLNRRTTGITQERVSSWYRFSQTCLPFKEDERRFNIFKENMQKAKRLQDSDQGTAEYGVTQFSDLTGSLLYSLI